jgi:hypothetical protein
MTTAMANRLKRLENPSGVGGDDKTGFLAIIGPTEDGVAASYEAVKPRYPNRWVFPMLDERLADVEIVTDPTRAFERFTTWT